MNELEAAVHEWIDTSLQRGSGGYMHKVRRGSVTGILVLEKMVLGPKFPLEKLVPRTIFSGKIGPTLKILVRPSSFQQSWSYLENLLIHDIVCRFVCMA